VRRARSVVQIAIACLVLAPGANAFASVAQAPAPGGEVGSPVDGGDAVIVVPAEQDRPILEGTGSTQFNLRLPNDASCPGDSANDDWRIQSFIVPDTDDPGTLSYDLTAPKGDGRYALYKANTDVYTQQLTLPNAAAGERGKIPTVGPLSFAVFPPGTLAPGRYRIGIACTYFRETAVFWDTQIDISDDTTDTPAQLAWTVVDSSPVVPPTDGGGTSPAMLVIAGGVVLVGSLLIVRRRLTSSRTSVANIKEHS
jgi:hypothetical protein